MPSFSFDVLKKDMRGNPVVLELVADLQIARRRLRQLASVARSEYIAFNQRTKRIAASLVRWASDTHYKSCE
jgi:hypothetical protein